MLTLIDFLKLAKDTETPVTVKERTPGQKRAKKIAHGPIYDIIDSDLYNRIVNQWETVPGDSEGEIVVYVDRGVDDDGRRKDGRRK